MKKILALVLVILMVGSLAACGKTETPDESSNENLTPGDIAVQSIEDCKLTDEEMLAVINAYFGVMDEYFSTTGEGIVSAVVVGSDGAVTVNTVRPDPDNEGETVAHDGVFAWASIREGYAYLYQNGVVDLEGNMTFTLDELNDDTTGEVEMPDSSLVENDSSTGDDSEVTADAEESIEDGSASESEGE